MRRRQPKKERRLPYAGGVLALKPKEIRQIAMVHNGPIRFVCSASVARVITWQNLLDVILTSINTTQGYQIFDVVKIKSIEMFSYSPSGVTTISCSFNGTTAGSIGDAKQHTDTSMAMQPAHLFVRPDPKCQAAQFQYTSSATAFTLYCPTATLIDVDLHYKTSMEASAPVAAQNALVSASPGMTWYRGLDGLPTASTQIPPVGLPQVI